MPRCVPASSAGLWMCYLKWRIKMTWTLIRSELRGTDVVTIRDKAGYLGHIFMARVSPGPVRDALEDKGLVEVEVKAKEGKNA